MLRRTLELGPQLRALGRNPGRAGVEVTLAGHGAADRHHGGRAEPIGLRAEQRGDHDVAPGAETPVRSHLDPVAQPVLDQQRLRLGEAQLPGGAGVLDRGQR